MARTELFARNQPGGVFSVAGVDKHPGSIFFVSSVTGTNGLGYGQNPDAPVATLAYALATLSPAPTSGDVIYCLPGHAETIASAAAITSIAGVTVIGLGTGAARPTFTWSTTGSTWAISTANFTVRNIRCTSTVAAMVKLFNITAANCTLDTVDYFEDGTTDALQFVLTTSAATDLTVQNCRWYRGTTAASALSQWIVLTGADRARILNNYGILKGYASSNPINSWVAVVTTFCIAIHIEGNRFYDSNSTGNVPILTIASTTGVVANNYMGTSATTTTISWNSCFAFQNFITNEVAKSGAVTPAIDTLS